MKTKRRQKKAVAINETITIPAKPTESFKRMIVDLKRRYSTHNWEIHEGLDRNYYIHPTKKRMQSIK